MILSEDVVRQRLKLLEEVAAELERQPSATPAELARDVPRRWVLERGLIAGANLQFDVTDHVLAGHFGAHPETYEAALRELCDRGVISAALYERLAGLGGLRNVLVHLYARIDPARIGEHARNAPETFGRYAGEILSRLDKRKSGRRPKGET